jgi:quercetin dioxygenase-like cupin family protein
MAIIRRLSDVPGRPAPNRTIHEVFSAVAGPSTGVTFRIVDIVPVTVQQPRQPHKHPLFEETIYVLDGRGMFWCEGEFTPISAGDSILVPIGLMHATFNLGETPLRLACFFAVADGVDQVVLGDEFVALPEA